MKFHETNLSGAFLIEAEPFTDDRGYFERTFCEKEFRDFGLETTFVQGNMSYNFDKGTLRGMHYQFPPHAEVKVVRCVKGAIWDVILDLREGSSSYLKWQGFELKEQNHRLLYIPEGFAHGFLTLEDNTAISYMVSSFYAPNAEGGLRWNDPTFNIDWPIDVDIISDRDADWPDFPAQGGRTK